MWCRRCRILACSCPRIGFTPLSRSEAEADDADAAEQGGRRPASHVAHASAAAYDRGGPRGSSPRGGLVSVHRTLPEKHEALKRSVSPRATATSLTDPTRNAGSDASAVNIGLEDTSGGDEDHGREDEDGTTCEQRGERRHGRYGSVPGSKEGDPGHAQGEARDARGSGGYGALNWRRECVAPALLLAEKRVRVVVFIFSVYSVRMASRTLVRLRASVTSPSAWRWSLTIDAVALVVDDGVSPSMGLLPSQTTKCNDQCGDSDVQRRSAASSAMGLVSYCGA